jgi:hypothetical protein
MSRFRSYSPNVWVAASTAFAGFAALASSVQSYLVWTGRHDLMRSQVLQQLVTRCSDAIAAADHYGNLIVHNRKIIGERKLSVDEQRDLDSATQDVSNKSGALLILMGPLEGSKTSAEPDHIGLRRFRFAGSETDWKSAQEGASQISKVLRQACHEIISRHVGR